MVLLPRNENQTYRLNSRPLNVTSRLDLGHDLDLKFSRSNMELLYLCQNCSDYHETKNKHINWTLDIKWPCLWIFKVKYGIRYIWAKNGPIAMKEKANISVNLKASNVTIIRFDLGHDLERWHGRIYRIVTGMTSDVGMPPTRLVRYDDWIPCCPNRCQAVKHHHVDLTTTSVPDGNINIMILVWNEMLSTE